MIKTLDELTDFLKICRKQGVTSIKFGDTSVSFGEAPSKRKDSESKDTDEIPTDEPSIEELMNWSTGIPLNENHKA